MPIADVDDLLHRRPRRRAWPSDGEQVEAVVVRGRDTEIKVYEGEIESLSSAESQGVGVRVIARRPPGLRLRRHPRRRRARRDARRGPRQRRLRHARRVPRPGRARRRGRPSSTSGATSWRRSPTDDKVELALELERAVRGRAIRASSGIESAEYVDAIGEAADRRPPPASARRAATPVATCATYALADEDGETQTGFGFSVGREPGELDVGAAAADAAERATRMLGCHQAGERAAHRRARPVGHRPVPRHPRRSRSTARRC